MAAIAIADFFLGVLVGVIVAAPIGAVNVLCIRRTLLHGARDGFITGLGAALGDTAFGVIAAFGLTSVSGFLLGAEQGLRLVGGIFLLAMAGWTWRVHPHLETAPGQGRRLKRVVAAAFFLTITNPATILGFIALFAGLGLAAGGDYARAARVSAGVFGGSALWWFTLTWGVGHFHAKLSDRHLERINRAAAVFIAGCGVVALASLFWS